MIRIFNTSDKPFMWTWNGQEFLIQPRGGGTYGAVNKKVPHPYGKDHHDEAVRKRFANRKITQRTMEKGALKKPAPDYLDIDEANLNFLMNGDTGSRLARELGVDEKKRMMIRTMSEMEAEFGNIWEEKQAELEKIEASIAARKKELASLEKKA